MTLTGPPEGPVPNPWRKDLMKSRKRPKAPRARPIRFKTFLIPVDFSNPGNQAVAYGVRLAKALGAEIRLLHVIEHTKVATESFQWIDFFNQVKAVVTPMMDDLAGKVEKQGIRVRTDIRQGTAYSEIVGQAKRFRADLIVMGTHGRAGMERWLMGSVAERVVRLANCPVLTIHPS